MYILRQKDVTPHSTAVLPARKGLQIAKLKKKFCTSNNKNGNLFLPNLKRMHVFCRLLYQIFSRLSVTELFADP
jgi:hypothetical protein